MMRDNGLIGLLQVIHACVREAFGSARAWTVMAAFALIVIVPLGLVAALLWLLVRLVQ